MVQLSQCPLPAVTSDLEMGCGKYQNHTSLSLFELAMENYESGLNETLDDILELANKKHTQGTDLLLHDQPHCDKFHMASVIILRARQLGIAPFDLLCTLDQFPSMHGLTLDTLKARAGVNSFFSIQFQFLYVQFQFQFLWDEK